MVLPLLVSAWLLGCTNKAPSPVVESDDPEPVPCIPADDCCRICSASQACGDACITEDNECSQEPGCACDLEDVCPDEDTAGDSG
ncbi:MAG: hypothetical protein VX265_18015 [Myxococcota bacterium]|nr:hypothetical protein [Myxococcota bacterium]MEC8425178.1 hypothetical protein [Myxococcota bacterium]